MKAIEPHSCRKSLRILHLCKFLFLKLESTNPQEEAVDSWETRSLSSGVLTLPTDFLGEVIIFILEKIQLRYKVERKIFKRLNMRYQRRSP